MKNELPPRRIIVTHALTWPQTIFAACVVLAWLAWVAVLLTGIWPPR